MNTLIASLSSGPAALLNLNTGKLGLGDQADICVFNPDTEWLLDSSKMLSKGHNTPFNHWPLKGRVSHTLHAGKIVYSDS